jgi:triacylglycerol lipase
LIARRAVPGAASAVEVANLLASPVWLGLAIPRGYGRPVLLVPGLGAPDGSMLLLGRWLRLRGYRTYGAKSRLNVACSERVCTRLEQRLEQIALTHGEPVAIVGHSRGGVLAKALAAARPDLVSGIVTLGSPTVTGPRLTGRPDEMVLAAVLRGGHLPNLLSWRCVSGRCGDRFGRALSGRFPARVGYVSIYSRRDRVVPWRSCRHPAARHVEVRSTHLGMAHNADVYRQVGVALGRFAGRHRRRTWLTLAARQIGAASRALTPT